MLRCSHCATELAESARFCSSWGAPTSSPRCLCVAPKPSRSVLAELLCWSGSAWTRRATGSNLRRCNARHSLPEERWASTATSRFACLPASYVSRKQPPPPSAGTQPWGQRPAPRRRDTFPSPWGWSLL